MIKASSLLVVAILSILAMAVSANSQFSIRLRVNVIGAETGRTYKLNSADGYKLEIVNEGKKWTTIHLYDKNGRKRPGAFVITNKDLESVLGTTIQDAMKAARRGPSQVCESCGLQEPTQDVRDTEEPGDGTCAMYRKFLAGGVPKAPLKQALLFYQSNKAKFERNDRYISIADYSQRSSKDRFYLLDLHTGQVTATQVSHGGGDGVGDPDHDGYLDRCAHPGGGRRNMTRVGFFRMSEFYQSQKDWPRVSGRNNGLRMEGLSPSNRNALSEAVVMHEAHYRSGAVMGRSWGCPAFVPGKGGPIMSEIAGGSMFYGYAPVCAGDMRQVLNQVLGWETLCEGGQ